MMFINFCSHSDCVNWKYPLAAYVKHHLLQEEFELLILWVLKFFVNFSYKQVI